MTELEARQEEMRLRNSVCTKTAVRVISIIDRVLAVREQRTAQRIKEYEDTLALRPKQLFRNGKVVPEVVELSKKQRIKVERTADYPVPRDLKRNGWTPELFYSAIKKQNGECAICNRKLTFENGTSGSRACTDHQHTVPPNPRGILCSPCNSAIGLLKDSPELCEAAAEYLRKSL
jgi:hypothetical protein